MENTFEEKVSTTNKILCLGNCIKTDSDNLQTVNKKLSLVLDAYKLQKKHQMCNATKVQTQQKNCKTLKCDQ